jgi:hypothetical protein
MAEVDVEQLKKNQDELAATVAALGEVADQRHTKTAAEIVEMKAKIAADDKRRRPWGFGESAEHSGAEDPKEFQRFDARGDKLHPLTRVAENRRAYVRTLLGRDNARDEAVLDFQAAVDQFNVLRAYYESKSRCKVNSVGELEEFAPETVRMLRHYAQMLYPENMRTTGGAMDTITELSAWLPTGWSQTMIELQRTASILGDVFPSIPMRTAVYNSPLEGGDLQAYLCAQNPGDPSADSDMVLTPGSKSTTGQVVLTSKKFGVRNVISDEGVEDTIVPVIPYLNRKHALAHALALDECITDGQTATYDTGLSLGTNDSRLAWNGLRYIATQVKSSATLDMSSFTADNLAKLRGKMGRYGQNVRDLVFIVSYSGLYQMTILDEVNTIDKYGPLASIITGYPGGPAGPNEVGRIFGIPIILVGNSIWENLNTSGVYDGSTKTCTCLLLVNKSCFWHGVRSPLNVRLLSEIYAPWGSVGLISFSRHAFADAESGATALDVVYGYKIAKA